ncbi:MAG: transposase [Pseudomonadota bacterium]
MILAMARPLRIEFHGAWHHVMNRGRRGEKVFKDTHDYKMFVDLLEQTSAMWNIRISAYCLMPNHYHILLQAPDANLSRGMRHLNGVYTQRFNRRHFCDGQLFRGRYKSILVSGDTYLLELVRYIHRNPLKAGLAGGLSDYAWSSHRGYLSVSGKWGWLHKGVVFSMLTENRAGWIKRYRAFVSMEDDENLCKILESKIWPSIFGPESFMDWVKGKFYEHKLDDETPRYKELAPKKEVIIKQVCKYFDVGVEDLFKSRRGSVNEPRNAAIYLIRTLRHDTLEQIGTHFRMNKYSSVSSIIERMKKRIQRDRKLRKKINELSISLRKSQEQT